MKSIKVEKGSTESAPLIIGHWRIGSIFIPPFAETIKVEILGSHDGNQFGVINDGLVFYTSPKYSVRTFDPEIFAGIQFIKLFVEEPFDIDAEFFVHLKDS